jgi:glycosyltransferase involved in cell wall biosynthesis
MKKRLLIISPHFSTGGSCQFTLNKVEMLLPHYEIIVVEYRFLSHLFVVQRNKMIELIGNDKFFSLGDNKRAELEKIVNDFNPELISMEEFPEMFMDDSAAWYLYNNRNRNYKIFETTHDSSFSHNNKRYIPDEFVFVSAYTALRYIKFNIPTHIVEYPVDLYDLKLKKLNQTKLDFDTDTKHVVVVGLFTQRKNQGYAFEIARNLTNKNILFHFIGNQAENFSSYWKPLMENKPENCIVHGEKDNVIDYLRAADLFLFPSKGDRNNKELNPLVIKEAQTVNGLPKLMFNLDVYLNKYNDLEGFHFLTGDAYVDAHKVVELTNATEKIDNKNKEREAIIIGTYPNLESRKQLTKDCIQSLKPLGRKIILISHYPVDEQIQSMVDYYIFDKYNPLTYHSYYTRFFRTTDEYHAEVNINGLKDSNQSFTVYTNLRNAMAFAQENGFKSAFYITYDVIVHPDDLIAIEQSFTSVNKFYKAYLSTLNTPFGKGIQTTAMTFDTGYYTSEFPRLKNADEYNALCKKIGSENFLEDFLIKYLNTLNEFEHKILNYREETFLTKSGLGAASNSEYYSILPIKGRENEFMFYFYTYNIDDRKVSVYVESGGSKVGKEFFIRESREYKQKFIYDGKNTIVTVSIFDGTRMYKQDVFSVDNDNIEKYKNTGYFEWKIEEKHNKTKIKLAHLQTTIN